MINDLLGIVQSLIGSSAEEPSVPHVTGTKPAERIASLRGFLGRLDHELPQLIVETLFESTSIVGADVGALLESRDGDLYITYSTDPSLLEQTIGWETEREHVASRVHANPVITAALKVRSAVSRSFRYSERQWILIFGERVSALNRESFLANEELFADVFSRLLQQRDDEMAYRSYIDHVTGLPDRWASMSRIGETILAAKRNNQRAALLFIDVNGFKLINDSMGHAQGDKVLRAISAGMRECLRANEFVGRIGGDEFAVILPTVDGVGDAERVARRLYESVEELRLVHESGSASLSIGIALFPDHAQNQEEWLHNADTAMYRSKRMRQPFSTYDPSYHKDFRVVSEPANAAAEAMYDQQFLLCFQPIFDVHTGKVTSVEALLRSLHPQDGLLSATNTMEAARLRRTVNDLDLWVTRKALSYASRWKAHGIERVHVNVGGSSDETFRALLTAISTSGADPSLLAVEMDSAATATDPDGFTRFAEAIARTGASVGFDGFGTGQMNLQALETLPISFVKLSRNLLPSVGVSSKGIEAVVALSKILGWNVIATRVATAEDRRAIREAGVKYMQGFAIAQPMTAIDFDQWIESSPRIALAG